MLIPWRWWPQVQGVLLVAWLVVALLDLGGTVPTVVVGVLAVVTALVLGVAVRAGWRRRL